MWLGWRVRWCSRNLDVVRRVVSPKLPISPTVIRVHAHQRSDLAKVIFANSITLTPGTVTLAVGDEHVEVHALSREAAQALREGEMDRRVCSLEVRE